VKRNGMSASESHPLSRLSQSETTNGFLPPSRTQVSDWFPASAQHKTLWMAQNKELGDR
jgi:hypothetical protein